MRHLFTTILAAAGILCGSAQTADDIVVNIEHPEACQVFTSDGGIQSFTPAEIDRIEFSNIDADGYEHAEIISQDIYLKSGHVVKIPINDIENVEFRQGPTVYAKGVTVLDHTDLWRHILSSHENSFVVDASTPSSLLPKVGDLLVTVIAEDLFPYGFSGRVTAVTPQSDGTTLVECASVDFSETLLEYTVTSTVNPGTANNTQNAPSRSDEQHNEKIKEFNIPFCINPFEFLQGSNLGCTVSSTKFPIELGGTYTPKLECNLMEYVKTDITRTYSYGDVLTDSRETVTTTCSFDSEGTFALSGKLKIIEAFLKQPLKTPGIPVGIPGLEAAFGLDFDLEGELDIAGEFKYTITQTASTRELHSTNKNIKSFVTKTVDAPVQDSRMAGQASFDIKLGPALSFELRNVGFQQAFGEFGFRIKLEAKGGGEFSATDITPYGTAGKMPTYYTEKAADCNIWVGAFANINVELFAGVKMKWGADKEVEWSYVKPFDAFDKSWKFKEWNKYPTFSNSKLTLRKSAKGKDLFTYTVDGTMTNPVRLGYRIIDQQNYEILGEKWSDEIYSSPEDITDIMIEVDNISAAYGHKAVIYPMVAPKILNLINDKEIVATPACDVDVTIKPNTGSYSNVTMQGAEIAGSIDGYYYLPAGSQYGFMYSTSSSMTGAKKVRCSIADDGSMVATLENLKPGTKYYYATYFTIDGNTESSAPKYFTTLDDTFVDLGLSVDWCTINLGGSSETDFGNLYAWGETTMKSDYTWDTYFDSPYDASGHMKGCSLVTTDIQGNRDYDAPLYDPRDDGRLPSKEEMLELVNKCNWEWTTRNGVVGYLVTSPTTKNSIFLPAAGMQDGSDRENTGTYGGYWTGTIGASATRMTAVNLYFTSGAKGVQSGNRYVGRSIRSVRDK